MPSILPLDSTIMVLSTLRSLAADEELTPDEAAREAGVTRHTIYVWLRRKSNPLPARRKGRRFWLIKRGDLARYMEENPAPDSADPLRQLRELPGFENLIGDALRIALRVWEWRLARLRVLDEKNSLDIPAALGAAGELETATKALHRESASLQEPTMALLRAALLTADQRASML